jgi:endonuclease YncB( thermonuclease family)
VLRKTGRLALAAAISCAACSSDSPPVPSQPSPPAGSLYTVSSITDGDTLRFTPALDGNMTVRFLHIDAPETAQSPWGNQATNALVQLLPAGTEIRIELEQMRIDPFGRILGHVIRRDGVDVNREQLRNGQGVLFVIWPNVGRFEEYRAAEIEAQQAGRGIWNSANPLTELPFEYRLRTDGGAPFRPVGDYFTRRYVAPADYRRVDINNRVFFNNTGDASAAGYAACPRTDGGEYAASCFAPGR